LQKNTRRSHPDYSNTEKAITKLNEMIEFVNQENKHAEFMQAFIDVQAKLGSKYQNIADGKKLQCHGNFRVTKDGLKKSKSDGEDLQYFLFNDLLLLIGTDTSKFNSTKMKVEFMIGLDSIQSVKSLTGSDMEIKTSEGELIVNFKNSEEKDKLLKPMELLMKSQQSGKKDGNDQGFVDKLFGSGGFWNDNKEEDNKDGKKEKRGSEIRKKRKNKN